MTSRSQLAELKFAERAPVSQPKHIHILCHLQTVLESEEFCTSRRASEFLRHIVERALAYDFESLKERLLGVEIFHRPSACSDAIVRVTANDVRRRLSDFYREHAGDSVRIRLPLGA